jgi:multicomponent Na+:H+ antiporter subunit D
VDLTRLLDTLTATADGLLPLALAVPTATLLIGFVLGTRAARRLALATLPVGLGLALAIAAAVLHGGRALHYDLGGWAPPLGIALRADGLSAVLLLTTAVVIAVVALYARADFRPTSVVSGDRAPFAFWTLLPALWAALNAVFLGNDLFNLYVALELLTFTAVPLVCLDGRAETLAAALRYLLFALLGSVLYLLGGALFYGAYGTLDIGLLAQRIDAAGTVAPAALAAAALMTVGLLAKTALFPLHLWLPPAHAGAPAAASALLSALVVKASFFLILRLWFDVMPELLTLAATQVLATLGAAAILYGGVLALRQARLKMLIAYSTLAQIGYLFLVFPLVAGQADGSALDPLARPVPAAWTGGVLQLVSHALAKAAMFMAAGLIAAALGHDRIRDLGGAARVLPMTLFAFGLAGLSLMGLPPSGGFAAKWLLLSAAVETGQWWWLLVMLTGGVLTGAYLFRVLAPALATWNRPPALVRPAERGREALVLGLALGSVLLGLVPLSSFALVQIGRLGGVAP